MEQTEARITMEDILAAMEQTWTRLEHVLEHFEPILDTPQLEAFLIPSSSE